MMKRESNYLKNAEHQEGKRIFRFLLQLEQDSVYDFSENSPYSESILSKEVKQYFSGFAAKPSLEPIDGETEGSLLEQLFIIFQLDEFEKMCVELVLLGEMNPYFEKFYVYMNNDWNQGYLTIDTAIRLYTGKKQADYDFFRYFSKENKLLKYFLSLWEQQGKGRTRWGLQCREPLFHFLCSGGEVDLTETTDIRNRYISEVDRSESHPLVTVMNTGYKWEDLVLPKRQKDMLKDACNRIRYKQTVYDSWGFGKKLKYGRGVSLVFSGPPGTGKTMSAGVVADCLGTTLYRVELAAVVSKYIGETEKNLSAIFETAKKGQGVLFFDEADVLFSKRTEVRNSNDKHSNMEAAYLLQKMEEYEGVVILATNYVQNMDEAFKRRIQFLIEFSLPDEALRRQMWEQVFPEQTVFEGTQDYDFLAEHFALSGSHIKNIALQAAFFAVDEQKGVSMELIIKALLAEMRKTGKRITREELREYDIYFEQS